MKRVIARLTMVCLSLIIIGLMLISRSDAEIKPILYWYLDGDAKDSSGQGNDGEINGNPKTVEGKVGKALSFNGKDDYLFSPLLPLFMGKPFTVGVWVKPASPVAGTVVNITSQLDGAGWCHPLIGFDAGGTPGFFTYTGPKVVSKTVLTANEWAYLAGVHDGKNSLIYVYTNKKLSVASVEVAVSDSGGPKYLYFAKSSAVPVVLC